MLRSLSASKPGVVLVALNCLKTLNCDTELNLFNIALFTRLNVNEVL